MSSFSSSWLLVLVQVSVSSSWRFAQIANTEKNAITDARTTRVIARARRVVARPASVSVSLTCWDLVESHSRPPRGGRLVRRRHMWEGCKRIQPTKGDQRVLLATDYPFLNILWTMIIF